MPQRRRKPAPEGDREADVAKEKEPEDSGKRRS